MIFHFFKPSCLLFGIVLFMGTVWAVPPQDSLKISDTTDIPIVQGDTAEFEKEWTLTFEAADTAQPVTVDVRVSTFENQPGTPYTLYFFNGDRTYTFDKSEKKSVPLPSNVDGVVKIKTELLHGEQVTFFLTFTYVSQLSEGDSAQKALYIEKSHQKSIRFIRNPLPDTAKVAADTSQLNNLGGTHYFFNKVSGREISLKLKNKKRKGAQAALVKDIQWLSFIEKRKLGNLDLDVSIPSPFSATFSLAKTSDKEDPKPNQPFRVELGEVKDVRVALSETYTPGAYTGKIYVETDTREPTTETVHVWIRAYWLIAVGWIALGAAIGWLFKGVLPFFRRREEKKESISILLAESYRLVEENLTGPPARILSQLRGEMKDFLNRLYRADQENLNAMMQSIQSKWKVFEKWEATYVLLAGVEETYLEELEISREDFIGLLTRNETFKWTSRIGTTEEEAWNTELTAIQKAAAEKIKSGLSEWVTFVLAELNAYGAVYFEEGMYQELLEELEEMDKKMKAEAEDELIWMKTRYGIGEVEDELKEKLQSYVEGISKTLTVSSVDTEIRNRIKQLVIQSRSWETARAALEDAREITVAYYLYQFDALRSRISQPGLAVSTPPANGGQGGNLTNSVAEINQLVDSGKKMLASPTPQLKQAKDTYIEAKQKVETYLKSLKQAQQQFKEKGVTDLSKQTARGGRMISKGGEAATSDPVISPVKGTAFAKMKSKQMNAGNTIEDRRAFYDKMARKARRNITISRIAEGVISFAITVAVGMYVLYNDDPTWGEGADIGIAVLWGISIFQGAGSILELTGANAAVLKNIETIRNTMPDASNG